MALDLNARIAAVARNIWFAGSAAASMPPSRHGPTNSNGAGDGAVALVGISCGPTTHGGPATKGSQANALIDSTITQVGCRDVVFSDVRGGRTWFTNILSHERVSLPGLWTMVQDEDGSFGQVYSEDLDYEGEPRDLDALFSESVYQSSDGMSLHLVRQGDGGPTVSSLDDLITRQRLATVQVLATDSAAKYAMNVVIFRRPREGNQRCFWDCTSLHTLLLLSGFQGVPSKWICQSSDRWERYLQKLTGCHLLVYSTYIHDGCKSRLAMPWRDRCLPQTSVATLGLVCLTTRWAHLAPQRGGFAELPARRAARSLLDALLSWMVDEAEPWQVLLQVQTKWQCIWPRPDPVPDGTTVLSLSVTRGVVDIGPLLDMWGSATCSRTARAWQRALEEVVAIDRQHIGFAALLEASVRSEPLAPFFAQLSWAMSVVLETKLGQRGQKGLALNRLKFAWTDTASGTIGSGTDRMLAQYNVAGNAASKANHVFGLSTDKATIAGIPMQITCCVLPNNTCIMAPPAVRQREN